jgi:TonB-linked SusC/RagA family outer membrane protein
MTGILLHITLLSQAQKVTLTVKNAPLETVMKQLQKQTGYRFVYTQEHLSQSNNVSVALTNVSFEKALQTCFQNQPLEYSVEDKYVVIRSKSDHTESIISKDSLATVDGIVLGEKGEPLPGASITVERSAMVTLTNSKGEFHIRNVSPEDVLIISNIGYNSAKLPIRNQRFFHVSLKLAVNSLDETVVIAYGTTTRRLNTGAVGRLTAEEIGKQPVSNPISALEGRITGLQITQVNGLPGSSFTVLIRGLNSIQSGTDPLYIIDGVPFLNNINSFTQRSGLVANSPFNTIDPATIESIEVLKDADATAIYGSRGANGVILITTKKSKEVGTHLNISYTQNFSRAPNTMLLMNTPTYLMMRKEAFKNDGIQPDETNAPDLLVWDTTRFVDWRKMMIGHTAASQNAQMQLSGGNANTKFGFGLGYLNDGTVFPGDFYDKRINGSLFVSHQSSDKKFNINIATNYSSERSHLTQEDLTRFIFMPPNMYMPYDSSGDLQWQEQPGTYSNGNPMASLEQPYNTSTDRFTATSLISYKLSNHLMIKTSLGYNQFLFNETSYYPISSQDPSYSPQGSSSVGNSSEKTWNIEPQIEYSHDRIGEKGNLTVLVGTTFQESMDKRQVIDAYGYTSDLLLKSLDAAPSKSVSSSTNQYRYNALFARINYNWAGKYLLNITGRRDGSSRFGPGRQFANFGAIGAAWIFTDEDFHRRKSSVLSFGKLRGSYGITGNDKIGNYQYLDAYVVTRYSYQGQPGLRPSRLYNPDFSWENNLKGEIALELGFMKNRLMVNAAWFKNRSTNQIIRYSLPGQTGASNILMNFPGIVSNRGWEVELQSVNIRTTVFEWKSSFNITISKNRLDEFPGLESSSYSYDYVVGQPLNIRRGYQYLGVNTQTGVYAYKDQNKDGIINIEDWVTIGSIDPAFYGGLLNSFHYKNWGLDIHFQFVKQKGTDPLFGSYSMPGMIANQPNMVLKRWQQAGDRMPYQQYTQTDVTDAGQAFYQVAQSSAAVTDASFIRCRNVAVQYNVGAKELNKLRLSGLQVFAQAQNIATITKYKGLDPESQSVSTLPPLFTIAGGIKLSF